LVKQTQCNSNKTTKKEKQTMAIDFDAIRKKLGQLSGQNKKSAVSWRPEEGKDYQVRIISFPDNDGQPFKDRWFYYGIGGEKAGAILAPYQFGKKDPIQDLITKLREENTPEARELCKKLYPKLRTTAAVIVRGEEEKGVRHWSFGKIIYQDLLNLMLDEDYGDITDPASGRDLKVSCTKDPKKSYADTKVTPRANPSPLSKDATQAKTWLSSVPRLEDFETLLSAEQIEKRVSDWLNPPDAKEKEKDNEDETPVKSKIPKNDEDEDEALSKVKANIKQKLNEINSDEEDETPAKVKTPAKAKSKAKKNDDDFAALNDAFAEFEDLD